MALNSQSSSLILLSVGITDVHHNTRLAPAWLLTFCGSVMSPDSSLLHPLHSIREIHPVSPHHTANWALQPHLDAAGICNLNLFIKPIILQSGVLICPLLACKLPEHPKCRQMSLCVSSCLWTPEIKTIQDPLITQSSPYLVLLLTQFPILFICLFFKQTPSFKYIKYFQIKYWLFTSAVTVKYVQ
jgi:hypothetical protein